MQARAVRKHIRSSPKKMRPVINLVRGKTVAQAKSALQSRGFKVEVVTTKNPEDDFAVGGCRDPNQSGDNRVWLQTSCAGEERPKGSLVRIYVNP